ncbi:hypothetical protein FGRA07_11772 [Fusarium graminearum]|nr:hypothetical protein FGRA07_11772 [Fusarium graminearum]
MDSHSRREKLRKDKQQHFLGIASIKFGALDFEWCRERNPLRANPDQKNVASLETMFRRGCDWSPEQVSHQIPALIDPELLRQSLLTAQCGLSLESLKREDGAFVELDLGNGKVTCLRGEHRVLASNATVANRKKRWIVRLYSTGKIDLSEEAKNDLADERASERQTTDAEYFYHITFFWLKGDDPNRRTQANPWFAQLMRHSENKAKDLKRFWSGPSSQGDLLKRFHEIPALFWGTRNQIRRVFDFWDQICGHDSAMKQKLDMNTVEVMSGRGSGAYDGLRPYDNGEVLRNFDAKEREVILSRLENATRDRVIPTLGGIFQNALYLQSVVDCLKHLIPDGPNRRDIWDELNKGFEERKDGFCLLQVSDARFRLVQVGDIDQFEIARRQLWLFALREFPSLPRKGVSKRARPKSCLDGAKLFELAVLAHRLGCRTDEIQRILELNKASWRPSPVLSACTQDPGIEPSPTQHGIPRPENLDRYKSSLFFFEIHKPFDSECPGSSFFLTQRSLYFDIWPDTPRSTDSLLSRASEASEHDLIDIEYHSAFHDVSGELGQQEQQLRASVSALEQAHDKLQQEHGALEQAHDKLQQEHGALEQAHDKLQQEHGALEQAHDKLQQEHGALLTQGSFQEKSIKDTKTKISELQKEVDRQQMSKKDLEKDCQEYRKQLSSIKKDLYKKGKEWEELHERITSVKSEVINLENHKKNLQLETQQTEPNREQADERQTSLELNEDLTSREFVREGYSMTDRHMKTLVPISCYDALKDEKVEEGRLIVLFKPGVLYGEHDFTDKLISEETSKRRKIVGSEQRGSLHDDSTSSPIY